MRRLPALVLALVLPACEAPQQRLDAAEDVRVFLVAAEAGDRATFDRHVDRVALKAALRADLDAEIAKRPELTAADRGRLLDQIVDGLGPEAFRGPPGSRGEQTRSVAEIAAALRPVSDTRVCLPSQPGAQDCAATFDNQDGTWRLVAVEAGSLRVTSADPGLKERFRRGS